MTKFICTLGLLLSITACGTSETPTNNASATSSFADQTVAPQLCTKDINEFGNPSACRCDAGYQYDSEIGMCDLDGRISAELKWNPSIQSLQAKLYNLMLREQILDDAVVTLSDAKNQINCEIAGWSNVIIH